MHRILWENIIKNVVIILILLLLFNPIRHALSFIDTSYYVLTASVISILALAAMFGCFCFSYEYSEMKNWANRFISHMATGFFILVIGISFEIIVIVFRMSLKLPIPLFEAIAILAYTGTVLYDFWDLLRARIQFV